MALHAGGAVAAVAMKVGVAHAQGHVNERSGGRQCTLRVGITRHACDAFEPIAVEAGVARAGCCVDSGSSRTSTAADGIGIAHLAWSARATVAVVAYVADALGGVDGAAAATRDGLHPVSITGLAPGAGYAAAVVAGVAGANHAVQSCSGLPAAAGLGGVGVAGLAGATCCLA